MASENLVLCPSAQPDWEGSQVIGVMTGSADQPELAYLKEALAVTDDILEMAGPVTPGEVFRFSAPCACSGCGHYRAEQSRCGLVEKVVRWTPVVVEQLPTCSIRSNCRWWLQERRDACLHCPQVVTNDLNPSEDMRRASDLDVV